MKDALCIQKFEAVINLVGMMNCTKQASVYRYISTKVTRNLQYFEDRSGLSGHARLDKIARKRLSGLSRCGVGFIAGRPENTSLQLPSCHEPLFRYPPSSRPSKLDSSDPKTQI